MAQQFPDVLGVATHDPMLGQRGADPFHVTEQAMLDQALRRSAEVRVDALSVIGGTLRATVRVDNKTGHKFPSGVGFRRAFIEFRALDAGGDALWASGRTNEAGVLVDEAGRPIAGERWWTEDSRRASPPMHGRTSGIGTPSRGRIRRRFSRNWSPRRPRQTAVNAAGMQQRAGP